ncbi:MAG: hypothetical protein HWE35_15055 [Rhodobacteraceae bacterium]|nr:hypothetical protein [Paracoccaceae bacterium]
MFTATSSTAGLYNGLKQLQAFRQKVPAAATADGANADASLHYAAPQKAGRDTQKAGSPADALTSDYIGPALEASRKEALEPRPDQGFDMDAYYQDLMNGCQAGPKPVSHMAAEANYAKVQKIIA